jgi:hypothetical protein
MLKVSNKFYLYFFLNIKIDFKKNLATLISTLFILHFETECFFIGIKIREWNNGTEKEREKKSSLIINGLLS